MVREEAKQYIKKKRLCNLNCFNDIDILFLCILLLGIKISFQKNFLKNLIVRDTAKPYSKLPEDSLEHLLKF